MTSVTNLLNLLNGLPTTQNLLSQTLVAYQFQTCAISGVNSGNLLTDAILGNLIAVQSGTTGSAYVTDGYTYTNFTPTSATVHGVLQGIDNAIGPNGNDATRALNNLSAVAINTALLPGTTNSIALGSSSFTWTNLFTHQVQLYGSTSGSTILIPSATASGTLTLPATTDTLVGRNTTDTLTNKTLTAPLITTNGSIDVTGAGTLTIGASVGANTLTLGGTTSTVSVPGILDVGSSNQFKVNASGNLVAVNNVTYSWPSSQGAANTALQNNGSGTLTWVANDLQTVYNNSIGITPDIQVANNDNLDILLGTGTSAFTVQGNGGTPTVRVTDGYVQIDGYLSVTGSSFQVNTTVTDADHWLIQPALSTTVALEIMPQVSNSLYTADLLDLYDGYNGVLQVQVDHAGNVTLNKSLTVSSGATFKYANSPSAGYFLKSDASGNATWAQIQDTNVATTFVSAHYLDGYTTVDAALLALDGYTYNVAQLVANTIFVNGLGTTASGTTGGNVTFNVDAKTGETQIYSGAGGTVGLAQAFSKTDFSSFTATSSGAINVTTSTGNLALTATTGTVTVASNGASSWSNASGNLTLSTTTTGNIYLTSAVDGYFTATTGELHLKDQRSAATGAANGSFRLSTAATDFSATVRDLAGVGSGAELGIIDAINAVATSSSDVIVTAGTSFAANQSYVVRWAVSGETAGRVYIANAASAATNGQYLGFAIAKSTTSVSAGQSILIAAQGLYTLASGDTAFSSGQVGQAVYLKDDGSGGFTTTPNVTVGSGSAVWRIGVVQSTTTIWIGDKQLNGIY